MSPDEEEIRKRQRSRSLILALLLATLAALFFAITLVKIKQGVAS